MDNSIPRLKEGIVIRDFDTCSEDKTYILSFQDINWQISDYLYGIISLIDGTNTLEDIAKEMSVKMNISIEEENIKSVIDKFIAKRGLLVGTEDSYKKAGKKKLRYLWLKVPLIKAKFVQKFSVLSIMFRPRILSFFFAFIAFTFIYIIWDVFKSPQNNNYNINYIYVLLVMAISTWFHEFGHASACMYYNLKPGEIGFAFYFTIPVLYSDVSCAWKLKRKQRVLVDVGGLYFQLLFLSILFFTGIFFDINILKMIGILGFFSVQRDLNPIIKMDGYWIISDLLGIPNLHQVTSEASKNAILKIFGIETQKSSITKIGKKEKIFFVLYALFFTIFIYFTLFMILKFSVNLPGIFYDEINQIVYDKSIPLVDKAYLSFNMLALLVTFLLISRVIYSTFSGLFRTIIEIIRKIIASNTKKQKNMSQ